MPLYIGDYLADTGHLTLAEHGAYLLMIFHYWRNGPLADDDVVLARIARMSTVEWRRSGPVLRKFFKTAMIDGEDVLTHKRIEQESVNAAQRYSQRSDAGKASGSARRAKRDVERAFVSRSNENAIPFERNHERNHERNSNETPTAHVQQSESEPEPEPEPESEEKKKKKDISSDASHADVSDDPQEISKPKRTKPHGMNGYTADFQAFYDVFPRHEGRGQAEKAYAAARKAGATPSELFAGAQRYATQRAGEDRKFTRLPSTWLNGKCWLDEPETAQPNAVDRLVEEWRREAENGHQS